MQPEQADVLYRMAGLQIDKLQSSILPVGYSEKPLINIVLTPVDQFDKPLKLPGNVTVELFAEDILLATEQFSASEVRKQWTSGWTSSGFVLQFPWPEKHSLEQYSGEYLTAQATFNTADGREFTAKQKLKVKKQISTPRESIASFEVDSKEKDELKQANSEKPFDSSDPTVTSDRRTIDEFPIFR